MEVVVFGNETAATLGRFFYCGNDNFGRAAADTNFPAEFERVKHEIPNPQFEKPPHTAFASSQHMAQKTLNSAS